MTRYNTPANLQLVQHLPLPFDTSSRCDGPHLLLIHDERRPRLADVLLESHPHHVLYRHPRRQAARYRVNNSRCMLTQTTAPAYAAENHRCHWNAGQVMPRIKQCRGSLAPPGRIEGRHHSVSCQSACERLQHTKAGDPQPLTCTGAPDPAGGRRPLNPRSPCPAAQPGAPAAAATLRP